MATKCVVFSEEWLPITDISPELYDTLNKRLYRDWRVWVAQVANVMWAVVKLALSVAILTPVMWFWVEVSGATGLFDIRTVMTITGLSGVLALVTAPRRFGVRNMFAEALSARVKRHVPALRTVSGLLSFVVYADHPVEGRTAPSPAAEGGSRDGRAPSWRGRRGQDRTRVRYRP